MPKNTLFTLAIVGILSIGCVKTQLQSGEEIYCLQYIPSACAPSHSGVLGIKNEKGEFGLVTNSEALDGFQEGDEVVITMETVAAIVCEACHCPSPDFGARILTISKK